MAMRNTHPHDLQNLKRRIDALEKAVAELKEEFQHQLREVRQVESNLLDMVQRLVTDSGARGEIIAKIQEDISGIRSRLTMKNVIVAGASAFGSGIAYIVVTFADRLIK